MDIEKLSREAGATTITSNGAIQAAPKMTQAVFSSEALARFAALVVEECAKVAKGAERLPNDQGDYANGWCAAAGQIEQAIRSLIKPSSPEAQSPDERPL